MFRKKELQAAEQMRRAVQLFAAALPETRALEIATVYPAYRVGVAYAVGEYVTCGEDGNGDPCLYRVAQAHTSQADWPPEGTPALYTRLGVDGDGHSVWSPPTGAQDAYNTGDVVSHNGALWRSKTDGNATEPGTDARWWETVSEEEEM